MNTTACVCSVDLGSSSIKAALIDNRGKTLSIAATDAPPLHPSEGTFDAEDYARATFNVIKQAVEKHADTPIRIEAIALSSQRATLVLLDKNNKCLGPAISWQATCGEEAFAAYCKKVGETEFSRITGLAPSVLYSVAKLAHLREQNPQMLDRAGHVLTLHDYLLHKLGAEEFVVNESNAAATGLFDISRGQWSQHLLDALALPETKLPRVALAGTIAGRLSREASNLTGIEEETTLIVGGGNQQCATVGAGSLSRGEYVLSLGTAAAIIIPLDELTTARDTGAFLTCHVIDNKWIAEGFISSFGSATALVANLIGSTHVSDLEPLASTSPPGANHVIFLPFVAGIGTPDFCSTTRGAFLNLSLATKPEDLARATLEGLAFEVRRVIEVFSSTRPVNSLRIVGGGQGDSLLPQLLSDITGLTVTSTNVKEAALMGAAAIAWHGSLQFKSILDAASAVTADCQTTFSPNTHHNNYSIQYTRYLKAVQLAKASTGISAND